MKLRTSTRLKGIVIPAIAAFILGVGLVGCSSSGDQAQPETELAQSEDGSAPPANGDPLANDANANAAASAGENASANGAEGNVPSNAAGTELQNAVSDNANANGDPAAAPADGSAPVNGEAAAGDGAATNVDPFAADNTSAPTNAAPLGEGNVGLNNGGANAEAPADVGLGNGTEAAPEGVPTNPAADPASAGLPPSPVEGAPAANGSTEPIVSETAPAAPANAESSEPAPSTGGTSAAGGGVPENGTRMAYYVSKGDTLAVIAKKILGNQNKWKQLASENKLLDANKIYAGDVIFYTLDDSSKGFASKYEGAPRQTVTVAQGDTLSSISAKVLGHEGSWRTLWKLNPQVKNPDVLQVGSVLYYVNGAQIAQQDPSVDSQDEAVEVVGLN